jgi:hypothetical protein
VGGVPGQAVDFEMRTPPFIMDNADDTVATHITELQTRWDSDGPQEPAIALKNPPDPAGVSFQGKELSPDVLRSVHHQATVRRGALRKRYLTGAKEIPHPRLILRPTQTSNPPVLEGLYRAFPKCAELARCCGPQ